MREWQTELSTENPECCQERIFNAKLRSSNPLSTNSFITRLLKTSVILDEETFAEIVSQDSGAYPDVPPI